MTGTPLRTQLETLANLQELDLKIDRVRKDRDALPGVLAAQDKAIAQLMAQLKVKTAELDQLNYAVGKVKAAQDLNSDRLNRSSSRTGEGINRNEAFQANMREIDQGKRLATNLETQLTKSTEDAAKASEVVTGLKAQLAKLQEERANQAAALDQQAAKFSKEIEALSGERGQFTSKVEPRMLTQYDRIRGARAGLGIVPIVTGGRCMGCNRVGPPQMFIEVQKANTLHSCPSCNRLVYAAPIGSQAPA